MALRSCPECKKEVSDEAVVCPNCGYTIKKITQGFQNLNRIGCLGLISLVILIWISYTIFDAFINSGSEEEGSEEIEYIEVTEEGEPLSAPIFLPLDSYIVKLKNNDGSLGTRYLKTTIQLMISEKKAEEFLKNNMVLINDLITKILQNQTVDNIKNYEDREKLRQNIISNLSEILPSDNDWIDSSPIKKVLFEEFIIK